MRALVQRVTRASVSIDQQTHAQIARGLLILLGVESDDTTDDADWLAAKVGQMRIFADPDGLMNLAASDVGGEFLVVSQFTLHASTKKGNRPSFTRAARPDQAIPLYKHFIAQLSPFTRTEVRTGKFGADMQIELINDGPVTIWLDSKAKE